MRTLSAPGALLLGHQFSVALLIEMRLSATIYWATCRDDIPWGGHTYLGGRQGGIEPVKDQAGEVVGLTFVLPGVPSDLIAIALAEPIQGKVAIISLALMEPVGQQITDVIEIWTGTLDQMPIKEEGTSATINVTAEHRGITYARPKGIMYSDYEQQRLYPGDRCLEFLNAQAQHQDVWPAASYFKQ